MKLDLNLPLIIASDLTDDSNFAFLEEHLKLLCYGIKVQKIDISKILSSEERSFFCDTNYGVIYYEKMPTKLMIKNLFLLDYC